MIFSCPKVSIRKLAALSVTIAGFALAHPAAVAWAQGPVSGGPSAEAALSSSLPDAPMPVVPAAADGIDLHGRPNGEPYVGPNPRNLPIVNGRPYAQPTLGDNARYLRRELFGVTAFAFPAVSAAISFERNIPNGWGDDFPGYIQRFGNAYGESAIRSGTRFALSAALHEDARYRICHHCTLKEKAYNAVLSEFTARRGADGHRSFSATPIVAGFSGPLIAETFWYPPGYGPRDAALHSATSLLTRIGIHMAREIVLDRDTKAEKAAAQAGTPAPVATPYAVRPTQNP